MSALFQVARFIVTAVILLFIAKKLWKMGDKK